MSDAVFFQELLEYMILFDNTIVEMERCTLSGITIDKYRGMLRKVDFKTAFKIGENIIDFSLVKNIDFLSGGILCFQTVDFGYSLNFDIEGGKNDEFMNYGESFIGSLIECMDLGNPCSITSIKKDGSVYKETIFITDFIEDDEIFLFKDERGRWYSFEKKRIIDYKCRLIYENKMMFGFRFKEEVLFYKMCIADL